MNFLDDIPKVDSFIIGVDLKTGAMIVATLGVIHPLIYGCSMFMPMSYLLVTIWILVALYFAVSILLFCGLVKDDPFLCSIWIWYSLFFVAIMFLLMILLALLFASKRQRSKVFIAIFGMLWYMMSFYFILVVNSHRVTIQQPKPAKSFMFLPSYNDTIDFVKTNIK